MITEENATALKDSADNVKASLEARNTAIKHALTTGASVAEIVAITGLTRARIYQIRDNRR
jgi:hypothetical protein